MPLKRQPKPGTRLIRLGDLVARRSCGGMMSPRNRRALAEQISRCGLYPPLIVRRHSRRKGKYEIIDGHQRAQVLRELGAPRARCEIWTVDDPCADLLAATLNQLRGRADVRRRARLLNRIVRRRGAKRTASLLGMTAAALRAALVPLRPPQVVDGVRALDLRAVVFHLPAEGAELLEQTLRTFGAGKRGRAEALTAAIRAAAKKGDGK